MRWRMAFVVCCLLLLTGRGATTFAQATATFTPTPRPSQVPSGCNPPFVPCGALPFPVPRFPTVVLPSPSAIPTLPSPTPIPITATPTFTNTPTATYTPSATSVNTPVSTLGAGGEGIATLADNLGSMAQTLAAQASQQVLIDGTPTDPETVAGLLGNYAGMAFGVVRAFQALDSFTFGVFGFLLLIVGFVLMVIVVTTIGSILLSMVRLILAVWSSIKPL